MLNAELHDGMDFSEVCFRVKRHLRRNAGQSCWIGLWSNEGRHGSVAMAELLFAILSWKEWASGE
eukprot:9561566-Heterocapsa_arctica.AAC.1